VLWLVLNEGASDAADRTGEGAMGEEKKLPTAFYLAPPKPNPFGDGTSISYGLPVASEVGLAVFDAAGRHVRTLVKGGQRAGRYSVLWNGRDDSGRRLANGVYFVRLKTPAQRFQRKVTLVKR
jgi:flagellar hook assembly protein FlgD